MLRCIGIFWYCGVGQVNNYLRRASIFHMGIGRREFLKMMGLAIGSQLFNDKIVSLIAEDRFVRTDIGISFAKPRGWVFIPPEQIQATAAKISEKAGVEHFSPSVMNVSRDVWTSSPRFTPGINVWTYPKEGFQDFDDLSSFTDWAVSSNNYCRDFRITKSALQTRISSCPATRATTTFLFDLTGLPAPVPIQNHVLCVEQESRFYLISMCDAPAIGMSEDDNFDQFQKSLVIA